MATKSLENSILLFEYDGSFSRLKHVDAVGSIDVSCQMGMGEKKAAVIVSSDNHILTNSWW